MKDNVVRETYSVAIAGKDANAALNIHVSMLTNADGDMTTWAVSHDPIRFTHSQPGVKQLIRLCL